MNLGRNEPCWCGSGRKYKKCHARRRLEPALSPFELSLRVRRASEVARCLHPEADARTCDRLISAHTVQRARVLGRLLGPDNHVLTFHRRYERTVGSLGPHRIGWRRASTITGFCARHDGEVFAPLERNQFDLTNRQCLLLGYRALCHEIHTKQAVLAGVPTARELQDRGLDVDEQRSVQHMLDLREAGLFKGLKDLQAVKLELDRAIKEDDLGTCSAVALEFSGPLCLACTGTFTPNLSLEGERLQTLHDRGTPLESLSVAVDATETGGAIVFSWLRTAEKPWLWIQSLLSLGASERLALAAQVIFFHLQNTYFSPSWWSGLSASAQGHVRSLAEEMNPYYVVPPFTDASHVPWEPLAIRRFGCDGGS